ncbi:MAG: hemolysin III family protein [Bacteroidetes bacterium]|nr:hemolysin III family protein [Bacteroidota bacterium]
MKEVNYKNGELANWLTHALAFVLSIVGSIYLYVSLTQNNSVSRLRWLSIVVYTTSLILLYASSTLYHAIKNVRWKRLFRMLTVFPFA